MSAAPDEDISPVAAKNRRCLALRAWFLGVLAAGNGLPRPRRAAGAPPASSLHERRGKLHLGTRSGQLDGLPHEAAPVEEWLAPQRPGRPLADGEHVHQ